MATTGTYAWGLSFGYDPWANLLSANVTQGSAYALGVAIDPLHPNSNRLSGYSYDAAGNMLNDGVNNYTFNGENEMITAAGVAYTYDGEGNRVQKSNGKLYWHGGGTDPLDETDASGNLTDEYIFFGGKRIARRDPSNNVDYYFADSLGTARVITNASGVIQDDSDFYPFGGEIPYLSSSGNTYKFTGKERDAESGLDNFGARYDSSSLGRFMSPDWSSNPEAVPYAKLGNPQSLNLYAYVQNDPINAVDLDGHAVNDDPFGTFDTKTAAEIEAASPLQPSLPDKPQAPQHPLTAPANSRTDVLLVGRQYTPRPNVENAWMWVMDWNVDKCTATDCHVDDASKTQIVTLIEKKTEGGPWESGGDSGTGGNHDHISVFPASRTFYQRWFVGGKQVQIVIGRDDKGNIIKTWELRVVVPGLYVRPVYYANQ
jgi:RHS repeat-associated protein